jgi:hypothetical protein
MQTSLAYSERSTVALAWRSSLSSDVFQFREYRRSRGAERRDAGGRLASNRAAQPKEPQNVPTVCPWSATAFGC